MPAHVARKLVSRTSKPIGMLAQISVEPGAAHEQPTTTTQQIMRSRVLYREGANPCARPLMMMMTFITQRGESQGKTKKERKATKSKGRGLEEGG